MNTKFEQWSEEYQSAFIARMECAVLLGRCVQAFGKETKARRRELDRFAETLLQVVEWTMDRSPENKAVLTRSLDVIVQVTATEAQRRGNE